MNSFDTIESLEQNFELFFWRGKKISLIATFIFSYENPNQFVIQVLVSEITILVTQIHSLRC